MTLPAPLLALAGTWTGTNRLWFTPDMTALESPSTASVAPVVAGTFLEISYTWVYEETPHEGILLLGLSSSGSSAVVVFLDSFHMNKDVLLCRGEYDANGTVDGLGSYSFEGGPAWGWRIKVEPRSDAFRLAMYNIQPTGEEALAVEVHYTRGGV